ncbi:MAG: response regulator transcription factor [Clostridiales bacterium]|nr:response regulator transcription factor [Clostridiales bacterium]
MADILIIEDEEPIRELIKMHLSLAGHSYVEAADGMQGLELIKKTNPDLILLDIMLPGLDGYELLPHIRSKAIPVIMITAKSSLSDRIKGLNLGADDYITKPFECLEIIARINALLRRCGKTKGIKGFDDIEVHLEERKVFKAGKEVELTPKEFDLLNFFIDHKGIAISREKLLEVVWEYEYEGSTRTVDMHVQKLRSKLNTNRIVTVYKIGYRLEI